MSFPLFHPESAEATPLVLTATQFRFRFPGESQFIEFKEGIGGKALQEATVAFSNAGGGVILIGVENSGRAVGRRLSSRAEEAIHEAISGARNAARYSIQQLVVDETPVVIVAIERRVQGFAQTSNGRVLVRRGPRNVALFDSELFRFISERSLERFDSNDSGIPIEQADADLMDVLAETYGWHEVEAYVERLEEQGLALSAPSGTRLTVSGALYLLRRPDEVLGKALVEVFRYPDDTGAGYDKRIEVAGPLNHQVEETTNLIADELGTELVVLGLRRHELPRIPERVLREAVANAVAHRSYEDSLAPTKIEIRPSEVKVISPGPLPAPVTIENIREAAAARNPSVIRVLEAVPSRRRLQDKASASCRI